MPPVLRTVVPLLAALAFVAVPGVRAQTASLRGFATDATDGQPLPGVNVALTPLAGGDVAGAATDADGAYVVSGLAPGRYALRATFVGYAALADTLALTAGPRTYSFALAVAEATLGEVTVEGDRPDGAANVVAGLQTISPEDVARVPAPDVSGDLANYLVTLPGVVSAGDQGGQLFIRGGEPTQNLVYLDGIQLYQPFHVLGFYSAFPTDVVRQADVYAGGYPARFGGGLSSVLDVSARAGSLRRLRAAGSVAPFISTALIEGPLVRDRVSLLAHARISALDVVGEPLVGRELPYRFGDVFAKLHTAPTPESQLSATAIYTFDRGSVSDTASVRPDEARWTNAGASVRYLFLPTRQRLGGEALLTASRLSTTLGPSVPDPDVAAGVERRSDIARFFGGFGVTYYGDVFEMAVGGGVQFVRTESALGGLFQDVDEAARGTTEAHLYAEPAFKLGGLTVVPGVRLTSAANLGLVFVEPRARATFEAGPHRFSAAAGRYYQTLVGLADRRDATGVFTAWATPDDNGRAARATHLIGGYRLRAGRGLELSVEGFYKELDELAVAEWTAVPRLTTRLQPATGRAAGADARVEVRAGTVYAFVGYGLASVRYTAEQPFYTLWFGESALDYRPAHDRRHQVSAFIAGKVAGFDLSARWQFGSGLPFSRALGFDVFVNVGEGIDPVGEGGTPRVIYERPYTAVLPTYHRLDVTAERTFRLGRAEATALVGVVNGYDRRNLFAFDVFTLRRADQLPLVPVFGLRLGV